MQIAITPGEPAGIGPDLVIQFAQQQHQHRFIVIADSSMLKQRAEKLGLSLKIINYDQKDHSIPAPGSIIVIEQPLANPDVCGKADPANAPSLLKALDRATSGCLEKEFDALVTGPLHKGIINEAGIPFTGHTEYLAEQTHTNKVVMMLAAPDSKHELRVALVTTHLPLKEVSDAITRGSLEKVIRILQQDLVSHLGISKPKIMICGLNPHAGEDGHLGTEEIETMIPVITMLRSEGYDLEGPYPADTLFTEPYLQRADAILAMYHDQGLPVLKHVGFGNAVNVTLGLPIIRTSVDHGTALDLAGSGKADTGSLFAAIKMATTMAEKSSQAAHNAA